MSNKFKVRVKLQGFELEMEGTRDDVPMIAHNVGQQLAGIIGPVAEIAQGEDVTETEIAPSHTSGNGSSAQVQPPPRKRAQRNRRPSGSSSAPRDASEETAPAWNHDPSRWGVPTQEWSTADKALWLLYVISQETTQRDLSAGMLVTLFNDKFRQSGKIRPSNVSRDFGLLKTRAPALVSDDTTKSTVHWFLTQAGEHKAQELVRRALGQPTDQQ